MNERVTQVIFNLSVPAVFLTGYVCYKIGEYKGACEAYRKTAVNEVTRKTEEFAKNFNKSNEDK